MASRQGIVIVVGLLGLLVPLAAPAQEKYPGDVLPEPTPPARVPVPAPAYRPPPVTAAPSAVPAIGRDAAAESLSRQLPLDPATRELRDRLPADVPAVERRLGLRAPRGPVVDLRGHTPSPAEIEHALGGQS